MTPVNKDTEIWGLTISFKSGNSIRILGHYDNLRGLSDQWRKWCKLPEDSLDAIDIECTIIYGFTDSYDRAEKQISIDFKLVEFIVLVMEYAKS